jgi:HSP20 family protein
MDVISGEVTMSVVRQRNGLTFSPWTEIAGLRREMDEMLNSVNSWRGTGDMPWTPPVNVREDAENIVVDVELPGIDPSQVDIAVEGQVLTITGEKRDERQEERESYRLVERRYGRFERSFTIPRGVDPDRIEARFDRGVLHLTLPKPEEARPRRIRIRAEEQRKVESGAGAQNG